MNIKSIDIDITEKCNLACTYCYHKKKTKQHMPLKILDKILRLIDCNNSSTMNIVFMGGEPLLAMDGIKYIVDRAENCRFQVVSNITLLTKDIAGWLRENKVSLHGSIDGPRHIQDKQRPMFGDESSSAYVEKNINLAKLVSPNDCIRLTLDPKNISYYAECVEYVLGYLNYKNCQASIIPKDIDCDRLDKEMSKVAEYCLSNKKSIKWANGQKSKYYCSAGINKIAVSTDGKIYPCHRFAGAGVYMLGFLGGSFSRVSKDLHYNACGQCSACAGGCPFINLMYGNIKRYGHSPPKDFCKIKTLEAKWAKYISKKRLKEKCQTNTRVSG